MKLPVVGKAHEAQAATENFHWFIYGSSLDRTAFAEWAAQHGYRVPDFTAAVPARLDGYRLCFDVASKFWGGAVASLAEAPGQHVEGIALPMPATARGLVDHKEGAISNLYEPFPVEVTPLAGGAPIKSLAYRAVASRRLPKEATPSPGYIKALARGAREWKLSDEYVKSLEG
jgi:gamma-glutamylcyclotransferase